MDPRFIRNFCIIAHIDHGKSTLADRLLELTGALSQREMTAQVLDSMDLERERGITIKAKSIRLHYTAADGQEYQLNLIDTPGHVDFSYEVSRALSACEGAMLVVDASQGVEAQTVANTFLAAQHNLTIIPVINKIDLPAAQPDEVKLQIENVLAIPASDALLISAKSGIGVEKVLEAVVARVPAADGDRRRAAAGPDLRFLVRRLSRRCRSGPRHRRAASRKRQKIRLCANEQVYEVEALGALTPKPVALDELAAGEVGFIVANIKRVADARMGDTIVGRRPARACAARLRSHQADGVRRTFPGAGQRLRKSARRARQTAAQRRLVLLRAGKFRRPGLRFPLRISRPAAHGNRAGASGTRIRHRPHHHRAQRALSHHHRGRRSDRSGQPHEISCRRAS